MGALAEFPPSKGYSDQGQANITLAWMMSQVQPFIDFDADYILEQYDQTEEHYKQTGQKVRPWSFGAFSPLGSQFLKTNTMHQEKFTGL